MLLSVLLFAVCLVIRYCCGLLCLVFFFFVDVVCRCLVSAGCCVFVVVVL